MLLTEKQQKALPSDQRRAIEQAKFAYSPLGKAFEKQTKTIEDLGEKQIKAVEDNKKQLDNLDNKKQLGNNEREALLSKEREVLKNIYCKRLSKIDELSKKIDYGNLKFIVNISGIETNISELEDPVAFVNSTKNVKYRLIKHNKNRKNLIVI